MNTNRPLNGCEINVYFCFSNTYKQLCTENCPSSLDVSEMFVAGVSSMYIYIMHYLNFFLSCSIKNLILALFESFIYNKT